MRIALTIALSLCTFACTRQDTGTEPPKAASADRFIDEVNTELQTKQPQWSAAAWVAAT